MLYVIERKMPVLRCMAQYNRKGSDDLHGIANCSLYKDLKVMGDIKSRRLGWADHIVAMEEDRTPREVIHGKSHNLRSVGKPRTRWADAAQRAALQILGIRRWRRRAGDRKE
jgi:hypothetical protein